MIEILAFVAVAYLFPIPTALAFGTLAGILGLVWLFDTTALLWRRFTGKGAP